MEIKEIIDVLRVCADDDIICPACPHYESGVYGSGTADCYQNLMLKAADTIESQQKRIAELEAALREQEEREKPLTLDELRQIAQRCDGVYVAHVDGSPVFRGKRYCAAALDFSPAFGSNTLHVHAIYGDRLTLWEDDYGKTWLAYRSKPKEDTK